MGSDWGLVRNIKTRLYSFYMNKSCLVYNKQFKWFYPIDPMTE